jgi:hypothetical protein
MHNNPLKNDKLVNTLIFVVFFLILGYLPGALYTWVVLNNYHVTTVASDFNLFKAYQQSLDILSVSFRYFLWFPLIAILFFALFIFRKVSFPVAYGIISVAFFATTFFAAKKLETTQHNSLRPVKFSFTVNASVPDELGQLNRQNELRLLTGVHTKDFIVVPTNKDGSKLPAKKYYRIKESQYSRMEVVL